MSVFKCVVAACASVVILGSAQKARAEVYFEKNIGQIIDGIGQSIGHRTAIRIHLTKEERDNGIRPPGGPSTGPHGLFSITFVINNINKSLSPSQQFAFEGLTLPPTWPANAWQATYVDPPGTGFLTLAANPIYGDAYLLQTADDFLDFQFSWQGDLSAGISPGYPFSDSLRGTDSTNFPAYFGVPQTEDGFHPFIPEPSSAATLGCLSLTALRRRRHSLDRAK